MRDEVKIVFASIFLVLVFGFLIFYIHLGFFSGFVVSEDLSLDNGDYIKSVTIDDALNAINESEFIFERMEKYNFSTLYVSDNLIDAKKILEEAKYADILRNQTASESEKNNARNFLGVIDWRNIYYGNVLIYTENVKEYEKRMFELSDQLILEKSKLIGDMDDNTERILIQAEKSFNDGRLDDADIFLEQLRNLSEQGVSQKSILEGLREGAKNFFQRYWIWILIVLICLFVLGYGVYKKYEKEFLKRKILKLKIEKGVLLKLMKRSQRERFEKNKISSLVYNIRMKKYNERLDDIKQKLPVLENNLRGFKL